MNLPGYDAWKTESGYRDMTEQEELIEQLQIRLKEMVAVLQECAEYFDGRSDVVDGSYGQPEPNREMRMLQSIEKVL